MGDYPSYIKSSNYAKHQQLEWSFISTEESREKVQIFTHHPGNSVQHSYWIGDWGCGCISTFQNNGIVLAIFNIGTFDKFKFIHAYYPKDKFDEVVENERWIFSRLGDVYTALYFVNEYYWTT